MSADFRGSTLSELFDQSMPATSEAIASVVDAVSEALERLEVPEQRRMEIALALQEALANAMVHGCDNDASKQIRCRVKADPFGRIVVIVTDPGPGFTPGLLADPKGRENLLCRSRTRRVSYPPTDGRSAIRSEWKRNQDVEILKSTMSPRSTIRFIGTLDRRLGEHRRWRHPIHTIGPRSTKTTFPSALLGSRAL